jgi:putative ABC transport system permease protein
MGAFAADVRHALRMFTRSRGLAAFSVLILVVGVLLNTAAFGIVNSIWFRPLPIRDAERVVVLTLRNTRTGATDLLGYQDVLGLESRSALFAGVAAFAERPLNVNRPGGEAMRAVGGAISANALDVLGTPLVAGRWFTDAEAASAAPVAVAADPALLGSVITVDGERRTVVGIIPASFRFVYAGYEVLTPLGPGVDGVQALARLAPGVAAGQARAALEDRLDPARNVVVHAEGYREGFRARHAQYGVLLAAAALILLIVCANLSGLFVARNAARQKEFAIRMAVGATRLGVVRLMLAEALVLAAVAGALSIAGAVWLRNILVATVPALDAFVVDYRVLSYTVLSCLLAGLTFGLAPASGSRRMRGALVAAQLAMGIMLLAGAAMLATSVRGLRALPTGMRTDNLVMFDVTLSGPRYGTPESRARFWSALAERASAFPGVEAAAIATGRPLSGGPREERIAVEGKAPEVDPALVAMTSADSRWFDTLGIRLLAGRGFGRESHDVAIVNHAFVRRFWGEGAAPAAAVGRRVRAGGGTWLEVIAVAADARQRLDLPAFPEIVRPYVQTAPSGMTLLLRTSAPEAAVAAAVRSEARAADPDVPVVGPAGMDGIVENYYPSVLVAGLRVFAVLAVALATLGLYGVVSHLTARRSREIGIRLALGATRMDVVGTVLAFAVKLIALGSAVGLAGSLAVGRVLAGAMPGVSSAGPAALAAIAVTMSAVAVAAAALPAWKAARLDPWVALRRE